MSKSSLPICTVRDHPVVLDSDLAAIYEVETKFSTKPSNET
jgi:hypothetical protein